MGCPCSQSTIHQPTSSQPIQPVRPPTVYQSVPTPPAPALRPVAVGSTFPAPKASCEPPNTKLVVGASCDRKEVDCDPDKSLFEHTCIPNDCDVCAENQRTDFEGEVLNESLYEDEVSDYFEGDDIRGEEGDYSAQELIDIAWSFIRLRSNRCSDYDGALRYLDFAMREMETDLYLNVLDIKDRVIDVDKSGNYQLPTDCQQIEYLTDQIFSTNDWKVCGEPQDKYTHYKNAEFKRMRAPRLKFYTVRFRTIVLNPLMPRPRRLLISYKANMPKYRNLTERHRLTSDQYLMIIYKLILSFLDPSEPRWTYYSAKVQDMRIQDNGHQNSIDMADNFFAQNTMSGLTSGGGF